MKKTFTLFVCFSFIPFLLFSQWNGSPQSKGTAVSKDPAINDVFKLTSVTDGSGGSIVVFSDDDYTYVQRINASGILIWNSVLNGVKLEGGLTALEYGMGVIADGNGGIFISIGKQEDPSEDTYNVNIYLFHIDASGSMLTPSGGVKLTNSTTSTEANDVEDISGFSQLCLDGSGGVIVSWTRWVYDNIEEKDIYFQVFAQRCTSSGTPLWGFDGVQISTATGSRFSFGYTAALLSFQSNVISDGAGGAILFFSDTRNSPYLPDADDEYPNIDVYAQRINANGSRLWTDGGVPIATQSNTQYFSCAVSDGTGGVILAYNNYSNGNDEPPHIYIQRINSSGAKLWTSAGTLVSNSAEGSGIVEAYSNGAHGIFLHYIEYDDYRSRFQQISANGTKLWTTDGIEGFRFYYEYPGGVKPDGLGNYIYAYTDFGDEATTIKAQKYNANGSTQWTAEGIDISKNPAYNFYYPEVVPSGDGSVIITYNVLEEVEGEDNIQVYAKKLGSDGVLPLVLTDFTVSKIKTTAELRWTTSSETNTKSFVVERSGDNQIFTDIGIVVAAGNSSQERTYSFTDLTPLPGNDYYRLKMIDRDGGFTYSPVKMVKFSSLSYTVKLQQNPVKDQAVLLYQGARQEKLMLRVVDASGRFLASRSFYTIEGFSRLPLSTSGLPKGVYHIQLIGYNLNVTLKMVKD